jgi:hypothetical protein
MPSIPLNPVGHYLIDVVVPACGNRCFRKLVADRSLGPRLIEEEVVPQKDGELRF